MRRSKSSTGLTEVEGEETSNSKQNERFYITITCFPKNFTIKCFTQPSKLEYQMLEYLLILDKK